MAYSIRFNTDYCEVRYTVIEGDKTKNNNIYKKKQNLTKKTKTNSDILVLKGIKPKITIFKNKHTNKI